MNRRISTLALVAAALIAFHAGSAEAKAVKSSSKPAGHKAAATTNTNTKALGNSNAAKNVNTTAIYRLPSQTVSGTNFGKTLGGRPVGHGPVLPSKPTPVTWGGNPPRAPTTPVTFGGNPPRAPNSGCGSYDGDCHHGDCHHGDYCHHECSHNDYRWMFGDFCYDDFFFGFYGDCDDVCGN